MAQMQQFDLLGALHRSRWLIASIAVAATAAMALYALIAHPLYQARVTFSLAEQGDTSALARLTRQIPIASLAGFAGSLQGNGRQEALTVLRSRELTEAFIEENSLMPLLFPDQWDSEKKTWKATGDELPTPWKAYRVFDEKIRTISEDRVSGIVTITVEWKDPVVAAQWANDLVKRADDFLRKRELEEADASIAYLTKEATKTSIVPLQQAIYRLTEEQINRSMMSRVREDYMFKVLDHAVPPDRDDYSWPNRPAMVVVGLLFGLLVGAAVAVMRDIVRIRRLSSSRRESGL